ncbi:MAG: arginase family protein, partial [Spirochaetales bacterium]|nr:arginase family protein [Spirochaetales bacterium]
DTPEEHFIRENSIRVMGPECFPLHRALENEVLPSSERAYIHIDLDVLDPAEFRNVKCPVREGITLEDLCASVEKISELHEVAGISILENTETRPAELELLRDLLDSCMRILDNKHSC